MNSFKPASWIFPILFILATTQAWAFGNMTPSPKSEAIAHTATVVETMSSVGYTYIRVEEEGKKFWIALPETPVTVGEEISFYEQMLMENFTSRSLNRTFDRILFVEAISKGSELPTQTEVKASPNKDAPKQPMATQEPKEPGNPVGQFTIQEVFEKKDELAGKVIEVKGKISKLTMQIMERNWVHVEDGTGSKEEKNNKIIFRTLQDSIAVGDEVVAKGVLYTNKDFGYGYFYPVIVEDAVFTK